MNVGAALRLIRPKQWAKNLLVIGALLFTRKFVEAGPVLTTLLAFAALCLVSSAVYCLNDWADREKDALHPRKSKRPIASGAISPPAGLAIGTVCLLGGFALGYFVNLAFLGGLAVYFVVQVFYTFSLKQTPVLDVFVLASGFVLRAALGAVALEVTISGWLLFCTGALALLIGFGKRRSEAKMATDAETRPVLAMYPAGSLDALLIFSAATAGLSYGVYALDSATAAQYPALIGTTPFVLYGIARYVWLAMGSDQGGEPENLLLGDPHMIVTVVLYLAAAVTALSGDPVPYIDAP